MQGKIINPVTPQNKAVSVNNKFGNTNIKNQQGTTRVLYDTLPLDGRTEFRFFENANTRTFPFTNLSSDGNRLPVGETFVIQELYFEFLDYNGTVLEFAFDFGGSNFYGGPNMSSLTVNAVQTGDIDFYIANSQVLKALPALVAAENTNPSSCNPLDFVFNFSTDIVIPPLLEYVLVLRTTSYPADNFANQIRCSIRGTAGILAPQTTF